MHDAQKEWLWTWMQWYWSGNPLFLFVVTHCWLCLLLFTLSHKLCLVFWNLKSTRSVLVFESIEYWSCRIQFILYKSIYIEMNQFRIDWLIRFYWMEQCPIKNLHDINMFLADAPCLHNFVSVFQIVLLFS